MDNIKINHDSAELRHLDELGEAALKSPKLMDLIVNGVTLMSVNKDTLRGIIRVILVGAAAQVTDQNQQIATLKRTMEYMHADMEETAGVPIPEEEEYIRQAREDKP